MRHYGPQWSGDSHLLWDGRIDDEARVSFRVARTSRFRLVLQCTLAPDYGVFQISLDGKPVGNEVDLYSRRVELAPTVDLGEVSLEAGKHRLTFKLTGANKKAKKFRGKGYLLGLDYFRLTDLDPPEPKPVEKKPETESAGVLIEMPDAQRLLKKYCVRCHSGEKPKGDVSLAALSTKAALLKDAETTEQITDAIAFGSMPPEKAAQPTKGERQQLARFFNALLDEYATSSNRLPPTVMRRLTRYEYNNAVRDLLKLRGDVFPLPERTLRAYNRYYNPASGVFPDVIRVGNRTLGKNQVEKQILDGVSPFAIDLQAEHGFNNRGNQLSISPLLLETFVKLGESIVNRSQTGPADPRRHGMKQLPKKSGEFLFEIIMRRHELRSTVMTS
nr:DUF1587 domain-containing protein [Planctomycetota bacterium]